MTAVGPMTVKKAIEYLTKLAAEAERGSEEEVVIIVSRR